MINLCLSHSKFIKVKVYSKTNLFILIHFMVFQVNFIFLDYFLNQKLTIMLGSKIYNKYFTFHRFGF